MMMRRRGGGRGESHDEYSPRVDERERRTGWGIAPPSRHLWVGNLSPHVTQNLLSEKFLRFGDLENIAYIRGRSYAFVNFMKEEDAIIALRGLQGFSLAGSPLRIEFAKGDKASVLSHDVDDPSYNEGRLPFERRESHLRRGLRPQRASLERSYDKSKGDKTSEPSEILWVGFPSFLQVDEVVLRGAFSPFGEIEKISTFPGRSYAFVRYRTVVAACRAKEALQGNLFDNPRVSICFAKSDTATGDHGRSSTDNLFPPHFGSNSHPHLNAQGVETFHRERSFDSPMGEFHRASPRYMPQMDRMSGDTSLMGFGRNSFARTGSGPGPNIGTFEHFRLHDVGSERRMSEDACERQRINPVVERLAPWHDLPFERPLRDALFEDSWSLEDGSFPLSKKLKTDSFSDKELPEYPFSITEQEKRDIGLPKLFPSFPQHHTYNKNFDLVPSVYKGVPDHSRNLTRPHAESDDSWRNFDGFNTGAGALPLNSVRLQRINPEPHQPLLKEEWKWEGTVAKGGTPVCRARCFPVGKVLDFMLPEFLNCTARTGLDMLAKHYYQAASAWVVFFVPETDADIVLYNEFMHYLGEKQRAAVAKLDEKITLFLVPPSDFSEQVLKVPGKVSISGVILKFQQLGSGYGSLHHPLESTESKPPPFIHGPNDGVRFHEDTSSKKAISPDFRPFPQGQNYFSSSSEATFPPTHKPGISRPYSGPILPVEQVPDFNPETRHDHFQHQNHVQPSNWSSHMQIPGSSTQSFRPSVPNAISHSVDDSLVEEYPLADSWFTQGTTPNNYIPETSGGLQLPASNFPQQQESKPQLSSSMPVPLKPEQLAQLAAFLGQQQQSGKGTVLSTDGSIDQSGLLQNASTVSAGQFGQAQHLQQNPFTVSSAHFSPVHKHPSTVSSSHFSPVHQHPSTVPAAQFTLAQQLQQHPSTVSAAQFSQNQTQHLQRQLSSVSEVQISHAQQSHQHQSTVSTVQTLVNPDQQSSQQAPSSSREEAEADPQKRLQATLQLAAALLQQIQQQAKTTD